MAGTKAENAQRRLEKRRERLSLLGGKARRSPASLSLKDLDEICTLAAKLCPPTAPLQDAATQDKASRGKSFAPFLPEPHLRADTQALLRVAHAVEYIAFYVSDLVAARSTAAIDARWKAKDETGLEKAGSDLESEPSR